MNVGALGPFATLAGNAIGGAYGGPVGSAIGGGLTGGLFGLLAGNAAQDERKNEIKRVRAANALLAGSDYGRSSPAQKLQEPAFIGDTANQVASVGAGALQGLTNANLFGKLGAKTPTTIDANPTVASSNTSGFTPAFGESNPNDLEAILAMLKGNKGQYTGGSVPSLFQTASKV